MKNEKAVPEIVYLLRAAEPFSTAVAVVVGKQSQRCTALPDYSLLKIPKTFRKPP